MRIVRTTAGPQPEPAQPSKSEAAPSEPVRIVLADDHELMREGIAAVIAREPEFSLCGMAGNEEIARELVAHQRPDLLLIDLSIGRRDELGLLRHLLATSPSTRILALAAFAEERHAERLLRSGARGFFLKSASGEQLLQALRTVMAGDIFVYPRLAALAASISKTIPKTTGARARQQ